MAAEDIYVAGPTSGTGGILTAATGTTLPTDVTTAPGVSFTATGYIGDEGVTMTVDRSTEDVWAWGGSKVRVITTEHSVQFSFAFRETNTDVLPLVFGEDNVSTVGTLTTVKLNEADLPHFAMVIDTADGDKGLRITAADAQVVEQDDITFSHAEPVSFQVTVECFPDSNGDKATLLYDTDTTA